jgi:hypothetical protein
VTCRTASKAVNRESIIGQKTRQASICDTSHGKADSWEILGKFLGCRGLAMGNSAGLPASIRH